MNLSDIVLQAALLPAGLVGGYLAARHRTPAVVYAALAVAVLAEAQLVLAAALAGRRPGNLTAALDWMTAGQLTAVWVALLLATGYRRFIGIGPADRVDRVCWWLIMIVFFPVTVAVTAGWSPPPALALVFMAVFVITLTTAMVRNLWWLRQARRELAEAMAAAWPPPRDRPLGPPGPTP